MAQTSVNINIPKPNQPIRLSKRLNDCDRSIQSTTLFMPYSAINTHNELQAFHLYLFHSFKLITIYCSAFSPSSALSYKFLSHTSFSHLTILYTKSYVVELNTIHCIKSIQPSTCSGCEAMEECQYVCCADWCSIHTQRMSDSVRCSSDTWKNLKFSCR